MAFTDIKIGAKVSDFMKHDFILHDADSSDIAVNMVNNIYLDAAPSVLVRKASMKKQSKHKKWFNQNLQMMKREVIRR